MTSRRLTVRYQYINKNEFTNSNSHLLPPKDTAQLCTNLINQLVMTTNNVLQLHQKLQSREDSSNNGNNDYMLKELENAVVMTQNMLTKITR